MAIQERGSCLRNRATWRLVTRDTLRSQERQRPTNSIAVTVATRESTSVANKIVLSSVLCTLLSISENTVAERQSIAEGPAKYLRDMLDLMEKHSVSGPKIAWSQFRANATRRAAGAKTNDDLRDAIRYAIEELGDGHTSFATADGVEVVSARRCKASPVTALNNLPGIGVVTLGKFNSNDGGRSQEFASELQHRIEAQDSPALVGWIVDLRGNLGGSFWPMLAAIGPLLDREFVGAFSFPAGRPQRWRYEGGVASQDSMPVVTVPSPYRLRERRRIAVLTDSAVASSGEAIMLAFRGQRNTRSFGQPSCGLASAKRIFQLSDGAQLNLTTGWMLDRLGRGSSGRPIVPDEVVETEAAMNRAEQWIRRGR